VNRQALRTAQRHWRRLPAWVGSGEPRASGRRQDREEGTKTGGEPIMVFAIVWQKRVLAVGAVLAATTLSVAGAAAAVGQHSPGDRGGRGPHAGASATLRQVS